MIRLFFVAGESSGDIHGANLIKALRTLDPNLECEGLGGRRMEAAGMTLRYDLASKAIMGLAEVVKSLGLIRKLFNETVARLAESPPDALILIDYPGFNLRLAKRAHDLDIPVVYYISPQVWAWKKRRVSTIQRLVKKMLVILPFEEELYREADVPCTFVGHPLVDHIENTPLQGRYQHPCLIGLLPGSRAQEIGRIFETMLEVADGIRNAHPDARFMAPCVDEERAEQLRALAGDFPVEVVIGETYEILSAARFCLVASGTATLEAALFQTPMAVLYRVLPLTYWLAKRMVDIEHVAMVNILAGRRVVPEFIQHEARPDAILPAALDLVDDTPARNKMIADLIEVKTRLGGPGASLHAAEEVLAVARVERP